MKPIYEPKGAAKEYGDWALNNYPEEIVYEGTAFKMIPFAEGYYASRVGEIVSIRNKNKTPVPRKLNMKNGYPHFIIKSAGKNKTIMVHKAVLSAWVRMPNPGEVARHLNDVKTDNRVENLVWGTAYENGQDKIRNGRSSRGIDRPTHKLTEEDVMTIRNEYADGVGSYDLSQKFGVAQNTILGIVRGSTWKHLPTVEKRKKHIVKRRKPYTEEELKNRSEAGKRAKSIIKKPRYQIPCKCGCGTMIWNIGPDTRPRQYAWGHNMKARKKDETNAFR